MPAAMVKELVSEFRKSYSPKCVRNDDDVDDGDDQRESLVEFFVRDPGKGSGYEYKYHCCSAESVEEIACRRAFSPDFVHIGSLLPDLNLFRKACAKARADVARQLGLS